MSSSRARSFAWVPAWASSRLHSVVRRPYIRHRSGTGVSAGGSTVPVIARLIQADEGIVRDVIHKFNASDSPAWTPAAWEAAPACSTVTTKTSS